MPPKNVGVDQFGISEALAIFFLRQFDGWEKLKIVK